MVGRDPIARRTLILYVMQMIEREYPGFYTCGEPDEVVRRFSTEAGSVSCAVIPFDESSLRYLSGPKGVITRKFPRANYYLYFYFKIYLIIY